MSSSIIIFAVLASLLFSMRSVEADTQFKPAELFQDATFGSALNDIPNVDKMDIRGRGCLRSVTNFTVNSGSELFHIDVEDQRVRCQTVDRRRYLFRFRAHLVYRYFRWEIINAALVNQCIPPVPYCRRFRVVEQCLTLSTRCETSRSVRRCVSRRVQRCLRPYETEVTVVNRPPLSDLTPTPDPEKQT